VSCRPRASSRLRRASSSSRRQWSRGIRVSLGRVTVCEPQMKPSRSSARASSQDGGPVSAAPGAAAARPRRGPVPQQRDRAKDGRRTVGLEERFVELFTDQAFYAKMLLVTAAHVAGGLLAPLSAAPGLDGQARREGGEDARAADRVPRVARGLRAVVSGGGSPPRASDPPRPVHEPTCPQVQALSSHLRTPPPTHGP
jgi:hypothetical protein